MVAVLNYNFHNLPLSTKESMGWFDFAGWREKCSTISALQQSIEQQKALSTSSCWFSPASGYNYKNVKVWLHEFPRVKSYSAIQNLWCVFLHLAVFNVWHVVPALHMYDHFSFIGNLKCWNQNKKNVHLVQDNLWLREKSYGAVILKAF